MAEQERAAGGRASNDWASIVPALGAAVGGLGAIGVYLATTSLFAAVGWAVVAAAGVAALGVRAGTASRVRTDSAMQVLRRLADEGADAVSQEELQTMGEFGETVFRFVDQRRRLDSSAERFVSHLQELPEEIDRAHGAVSNAGGQIEEAVEETASLLAHINSSIRGINSEVESLSRSTEEASASIQEMGSSIDEVARGAGALHDSANASTSSVHEISASIRQVAESADAVQGMAEESAAAMVQMDRAIQEVSQHVGEASQLTENVSSGADAGSEAVAATIDGIAEIRRQTLDAKAVLERLADRIGEIGEIVNVIGSINEETNLLSLNAAIIAAQAGEQGKAFAVVANHVKTLAQRTAQSTQEIESLITAVQDESGNAVHAMAAGIEAVETGVERSRKAGEHLDGIRDLARDSSSRVAEIARATGEQSRNSKHVAEAAQRTSSMVQQITQAMSEQSRASEGMLQNAESSLELCGQVHRSTEEQRETARFITASVTAISEMIRSIQGNTESHGAASEAMSEAVDRILEIAKESGSESRELQGRLEALQAEARSLGETAS